MVPAPCIIRWMKEKFNFIKVNISFLQMINRSFLHGFIIHINANDLAFTQFLL